MTLKTLPVDTIDSTGKAVSHIPRRQTDDYRVGITWEEGQWVIYDIA